MATKGIVYRLRQLGLCSAAILAVLPASAQIKVGVSISTTGPAASLGIPQKNTATLFPSRIGPYKVEYVIIDDQSDTTQARKNAEKLVNEDKVDVIIGPSITPSALAMTEVVARAETPMVSMASASAIIEPMTKDKAWVFKTAYSDKNNIHVVARHMAATGVKSVAMIAFSDAYGEGWVKEFQKAATDNNIKLLRIERYNRTDTSVTAQALQMLSANPDAALIVAAGTPGVLPQTTLLDRGYKGKIYQTAGVVTLEFLNVGGKAIEGTWLPAGPVIVVDELPDTHVAKQVGTDYKRKYEASFGAGTLSTLGANAWDSMLLVQNAVQHIGTAHRPGSVEFRRALRTAIENTKNLKTTHGEVTMSPTDHMGFSMDAPTIITIKNRRWALAR